MFYTGVDGNLDLWHWTGNQWSNQELNANVETGTSPTAFTEANGNLSRSTWIRTAVSIFGYGTGRNG